MRQLATILVILLLPATSWGWRELPAHLWGDVKTTFWNPWHAVGLAAGTGATLGLHEFDREIQDEFHPSDPLGDSRHVFNIMGDSLVLGGATVAAAVITKLVDSPQGMLTTEAMLEALAINYALTFPLKFATQRTRPDGSNDHSFPSAHASGAFTLATVTEVLYGPLYGIPSYALAGMIALSRIDANKHFASDTAAGALLGTLVGLGTAKFHQKEKPGIFVLPMVESGIGLRLVGEL